MFFQLQPDEKIVLTLRRHWFVLTMIFVRVLPLFFVPLVARLVIPYYIDLSAASFASLFWFLSSLWWLFVWAGLAILWVDNYLDFWVITNQRIVSTYQMGLFRREVSELSFSRIQDLTVNVKGILKTFIGYGNLEVRTAGTFEKNENPNIFVLQDIPRPYDVQSTLSRIHLDYSKKTSPRI